MSNYFFIGQKPALAADCSTFLSHSVSAYADVSPVTDVWQWFLRRCVTDAKESAQHSRRSQAAFSPLPPSGLSPDSSWLVIYCAVHHHLTVILISARLQLSNMKLTLRLQHCWIIPCNEDVKNLKGFTSKCGHVIMDHIVGMHCLILKWSSFLTGMFDTRACS